MSRFSYAEADNYGASNNKFFGLKDDGDTATVRFLINDINDLQGVAVHEVQDGDKRFDVECLRAYNEPVDNCPLCAAGYKQNAKLFIPLFDENSKESKIWTRGKAFFKNMSGLCAKFHPLVQTPVEIQRNGKKGDTSTTYQMYPDSRKSDNSRIEDYPEISAENLTFMTKSYEEMEYFINNGTFPVNTNQSQNSKQLSNNNVPVRRRPAQPNEEVF